MTREEAIKFWKFRYENAKDYTDPHWEAQERREHREYVEALRMAIESLQREDEFLKNLESNEPQFYDEDDYWNGRIPTVQAEGGDAEMNEVKSPYMQHSPNGATHGRLIDADALKENMTKAVVRHICTNTLYNTIMAVIDSATTVQADRPHGEWIETSEGTMCGNCHKFPYDDGEYHIANWHSDFCPNCGCAMDMSKETK